MKLSFYIFIGFLILVKSDKPLQDNIARNIASQEISDYQMYMTNDNGDTTKPIDRRLTLIPFGNTENTRIDTVERKINTNMMRIPTGPTDTEELFAAQAKTAAKEQVEKRAEMARKRKAAKALKETTASTNTTTKSFPSIGRLEEKQAKAAAKELLEKRAILAAKNNSETDNTLMAYNKILITKIYN